MYKCVSLNYPNVQQKGLRQKTTMAWPEHFQDDTKNST